MADGVAPGAAGGSSEGSIPGAPAAVVDQGGSQAVGASADLGHAPGVGGDAGLASDAAASVAAPASAPSEFVFGGRKFKSQAEAEAYLRRQLDSNRGLTNKLTRFEQLEAENAELHRALNLRHAGGEQGTTGGEPAASKGWGDELTESGDLDLLQELAERAEAKGQNPLRHALYGLAQIMGERVSGLVDKSLEERIAPREAQDKFNEYMTGVTGAVHKLTPDYPELDDANQSPEANEARQAILAIWKSFPKEFSIGQPLRALRLAVQEYRETNGTPVFAVAPGTSGSPSAKVASAAERAAGAGTAVLDSGTPSKPRPGAVPKTPQQELEEELGAVDRLAARGAGGMDLGVRRIS